MIKVGDLVRIVRRNDYNSIMRIIRANYNTDSYDTEWVKYNYEAGSTDGWKSYEIAKIPGGNTPLMKLFLNIGE